MTGPLLSPGPLPLATDADALRHYLLTPGRDGNKNERESLQEGVDRIMLFPGRECPSPFKKITYSLNPKC